MTIINSETFSALAPAAKQQHVSAMYAQFQAEFEQGRQQSPRNGKTQGSAFLWISLYGKDALTKAFKAFLKKQGARVIDNYRGDKNAWFFGSQNDLGFYDGLQAANKVLTQQYGLASYVGDAWD